MNYKGTHIVCDVLVETIPSELLQIIRDGIGAANMTVIKEVVQEFTPQGITGVWILSESHFTVHTYPEHNYLSMDCYTCGEEGDPNTAMQHILQQLLIVDSCSQHIPRGDCSISTGFRGIPPKVSSIDDQ